ncbi:beta-glucosidase BglX [Simiduia curdlanivorans]|uniref:beta-glucosidase n=1 Tax=Simiduia curdlanivorans TaxID=1492769 RepID=A0ABV8V426_9GAMM|nr:beta-glucosidase BglX [Simiduia curdlanivorans]MDN3637489.1 beta-glucosidase BglX [Simiduia curdlanivorans]
MKTARALLAVLAVSAATLLSASCTNEKPAPQNTPSAALDPRVEEILASLTLEQKIGQLSLRDWGTYETEAAIAAAYVDVKAGRIGGFLNVSFNKLQPNAFSDLQTAAVQESASGIPLLFGQDVIHGYKTIFPIPLGQAASWNPEVVEAGARVAAKEASSAGINWTFAPMIDISRDPRWGRIAETLGEDPHLTSVLGVAMTKGFQTDDPSRPDALAASAKHFAGYGAAEGGRDYNAANIPENLLRDIYLPPFKANVDAGLLTIMSSYNTLNGVPATANQFLLKDILRKEWAFDGFVVSDWNAVLEMIPHGAASDDKHAAQLALDGGVDYEMHTATYQQQLPALVAEGKITEAQIDQAVRHMLKVKLALGLFDNRVAEQKIQPAFLTEEYLDTARAAARESFVLLKNSAATLPLKKQQKIGLVGPLADVPHEQLGTWIYDGDKKDSRSLLPALTEYLGGSENIVFAPTLKNSRDLSSAAFATTLKQIADVDVILYMVGEESILSGEGHSRGDISLPGAQRQLLDALATTGKPIVMVIMAGRPIALEGAENIVDALMMAWHPGTMAGPALVDVLFGDYAPKGRLPLTWPKASGQIPIYYNHLATGRPATDDNYTKIQDIEQGVFQHVPGNSSNLLDYGHLPQFPFGYGLTYGKVNYSDLQISHSQLKRGGNLDISAKVSNAGDYDIEEVVQLYIRDKVATVARPVRELKDFKRVQLAPGESKTVSFSLQASQLAFHNAQMQYLAEPGEFDVWIAPNAEAGLKESFTLTD